MVTDDEIDESVSQWISQIREGDEQGLEKIWRRYYRNLISLARTAASQNPARFADEEDVVQSTLASFWLRVQEGRYPELHDRSGLWKLLISMTLTKLRAMSRKEGRRHELLQQKVAPQQRLREEPSPAFAVEVAEQIEQLMARLKDEPLRRIALAKLEGFTNEEIAKQLDVSLATVERKLRLIRELWTSHLDV